jgi:hypothetical protein
MISRSDLLVSRAAGGGGKAGMKIMLDESPEKIAACLSA